MSKAIKEKYWTSQLAATHKPGAWEALNAGYSEGHRAYHAWGHIGDLLKKLDGFSSLASRPDLVATAIFWHDAVYKTQKPDGSYRPDIENVRESAELFRKYTLLPFVDAEAVFDMIMATGSHMHAKAVRHHYNGFANDLDLFLDLDLSALGAPWKAFARNTEKIQTEFAWVPEADFCRSRAGILRGFVEEGVRLYRRNETNSKWGAKARINLLRSIAELGERAATLS